MGDRSDNLECEVRLTLELVEELRLEGSPDALADALELELACDYWDRLLPAVRSCLGRVERGLLALPFAGAAMARAINRALRQVNAAVAHSAPLAQTAASPMVSAVASKVAGSAVSAMLIAVPVTIVANVATAHHPSTAPTTRGTPSIASVALGNVAFHPTSASTTKTTSIRHHRLSARHHRYFVPLVGQPFSFVSDPTPAGNSGAAQSSASSDSTGSATSSDSSTTPPSAAAAPLVAPTATTVPQSVISGLTVGHEPVATILGAPVSNPSTSASAAHLTPVAPTTSSVTTSKSSAFTDQLATTGGSGSVTYTDGPTSSTALVVSAAGIITTTGTLHAGTYTASGTDADTAGDTGTWSYSLTVTPAPIVQAPLQGTASTGPVTSGTATTTKSGGFTSQLTTTGAVGAVTYAESSTSSSALMVSSAGAITTIGTLHAGTYTATGTDSDAYGDTGTWSYTVTVAPVAISEGNAAPSPVSTTKSGAFTDQLTTSGGVGAVTYAESATSSPDLVVSSSGAITTTGMLHAGTYTATGTDSDAYGDTGTWSYTLTVSPVTLTQNSAVWTATTAKSAGATAPLTVDGANGAVSFKTLTATHGLAVSDAGVITTAGTLHAGTYTASGTDTDAYGDTGTWSETLTVTAVTITNSTSPTHAVTTAKSGAFTDHLTTTGGIGDVTYAPSPGPSPTVVVSPAGVITTAGTLHAGTYTATGTDSDAYGDTGTWSYSLTVSPVAITQSGTSSNSATTTKSAAFAGQLTTTGATGAVTYTQGSGAASLVVSSAGAITTTGTLHAGTYAATGTDTDAYGDTGTWSYGLTVNPIVLTVSATGSTSPTASAAFADQLSAQGALGAVTYTVTLVGVPAVLLVSSSGAVTTGGTLQTGAYETWGNVTDAYGDTGKWSYTLNVSVTAPAGS